MRAESEELLLPLLLICSITSTSARSSRGGRENQRVSKVIVTNYLRCTENVGEQWTEIRNTLYTLRKITEHQYRKVLGQQQLPLTEGSPLFFQYW